MKVYFKVIFLSLIATGMVILIYFNSAFYIKKQFWKSLYNTTRIGDFIKFDGGYYEIKGRTILREGKPVAKIVFCWGKELYIEELSSKAIASYTNKDFDYF